jgi:hypothetical protein
MEDITKFSFREFRFSAPARPHTCRGFLLLYTTGLKNETTLKEYEKD